MKIININEKWGMPVEFIGDTEKQCVTEMITAIRACGYDVDDLTEGIDYEIIETN
jgi:hypothetical protein